MNNKNTDFIVGSASATNVRTTGTFIPQGATPQLRTAEKYAIFTGLGLLWLLATLPTVLLSQWFPLDMPALFFMGEHLSKWLPWIVSPYNGSGRYFPLYWLYHCVQYLAFGAHVWAYFVVLSVIYLAGAVLICRTVWRMTGSLRMAALLFIALYLNSPTVENLTTIGKGEPLAFFLLACMIALFHRDVVRGGMTRISMGISALCFVMAIWIKETSLVLAGFAATGTVLCFVLGRVNNQFRKTTPIRPYLDLIGALGAGWLVSKLPYVVFPKVSSLTSYTDYAITRKLVKDNVLFYVNQQPDVLIFGLLALLLLGLAARSQWRSRGEIDEDGKPAMLVFAASLCAMGWSYYFAMLFWRWPMAYYMLLPSITFKLCAFYGLYVVARNQLMRRWGVIFIKGVMAVAVFWSALAVYYIGSSQIAYSRIYTHALKQYQEVSGGTVPLIIESHPFFAEQVGGTEHFLKDQLGFTSTVTGIAELLDPAVLKPELMELLEVTPEKLEENVRKIPRKGQYLLVFTGNKLATWFLRGVTPYFTEDSLLKLENVYDMELVAQKSIETPATYLHAWTHRMDSSSTYVGYKLYRVLTDKPRFLWRGRYPDGWVGFKSSLKIDSTYAKRMTLKMSVPPFTLPNRVRITRDGALFKEVEFKDTNEVTIDLGPAPADSTQLIFEVARAVSPKDIRMNKDDRKLGARIALVPTIGAPSALLPASLPIAASKPIAQ
jgi:hypothetical protein